MSSRNLDKIDRIVVDIDQMTEISSWVQKQGFDSINIPMNEVLVILENIYQFNTKKDIGLYFKLDEESGNINIRQYDMDDRVLLMSAIVDDDFFINGKVKVDSKYDEYFKGEYFQTLAMQSVLIVFDLFQYIVNREELVISKKETHHYTKNTKSKKKKKNSPSKRIIKSSIVRYEILKEEDSIKEKREYSRHVHAWTVRGHWRFYKKTGKKVWIDGYVKGNKDEEIQQKIYEIQKETT